MANYVKIATLGPRPPLVDAGMRPQDIVDFMIEHWRREFAQVLPDKPDLIVVHEACDRPRKYDLGPVARFSMERHLEYYRTRNDQVRDFFAEVARENHCYVVYSAAREAEGGTWRNASTVLDRSGAVAGTYNKNHPTIGELSDKGVLRGKDAPIIACDFGRVACALCFDLNFDELRLKYVRAKPDLLIFSSMYHGGDLVQGYWAYSCRSHWVSAVAGWPSEIRNPFGQVVASSTCYRDYAMATVNLDCCLAHYDYNGEKLKALKSRYGRKVDILDPGYVGSVLISSRANDVSVAKMAEEFGIELLDDYFARALAHQHNPKYQEK